MSFSRYAFVSGIAVILLGVAAGAVTLPHTVIEGGGPLSCSVSAVPASSVNSIYSGTGAYNIYVYYSGFSANPVNVQVNFGNGQSSPVIQSYSSPTSAGTTYASGTYTATGTVTDQYYESCSASTTLTYTPTTTTTTSSTTTSTSSTPTTSTGPTSSTTTTTSSTTTSISSTQSQTYTATYVSTSTSTYVTQTTVTNQGQTTVVQTTLSSTYTTQVTTTGITSVNPTGPNTPVNGALVLLGLFLVGLAAVPFILKRARLGQAHPES